MEGEMSPLNFSASLSPVQPLALRILSVSVGLCGLLYLWPHSVSLSPSLQGLDPFLPVWAPQGEVWLAPFS